jgi:hypothetical protein
MATGKLESVDVLRKQRPALSLTYNERPPNILMGSKHKSKMAKPFLQKNHVTTEMRPSSQRNVVGSLISGRMHDANDVQYQEGIHYFQTQ